MFSREFCRCVLSVGLSNLLSLANENAIFMTEHRHLSNEAPASLLMLQILNQMTKL